MTVQYIKDTIKQAIEHKKKEEPANYQFYSKFLGNINMFMTPELEKIFDNYSSELNGYFNK